MFPACTTEKPPVVEAEDAKLVETETRTPRRKIERLDPKTFVELTIELMREEAKWNEEVRRLVQEKRTEYFASYGLSEKQFNEFLQNNNQDFQRFLQDNPHYNQAYLEASMLNTLQSQ
jgi:hypothetical protein